MRKKLKILIYSAFLLLLLLPLLVMLLLCVVSWWENHVSDQWLIHAMELRLEEAIPDQEAIIVREKRLSEWRDYHLELLMTVKDSDAFDNWARIHLVKTNEAETEEIRKSESVLLPKMAKELEELLLSGNCLWKVSIRRNNSLLERMDWLAFDPESRALLFLASDY